MIMQSVPIMMKIKGFTSKLIQSTVLCGGIIHTKTKRHHVVYSPSQQHVDNLNVQTVQGVAVQISWYIRETAFSMFVSMIKTYNYAHTFT